MNEVRDIFEQVAVKAREKNLTLAELCKSHIKMEPSRFSKIKNGTLQAPDHRRAGGRRLYRQIGEFLGISETEVLARIVFGDKQKVAEKKIVKLLDSDPAKLLSRELQDKMTLIGLNSAGREECLDLVLDIMKSYIKHVRKEEWREL